MTAITVPSSTTAITVPGSGTVTALCFRDGTYQWEANARSGDTFIWEQTGPADSEMDALVLGGMALERMWANYTGPGARSADTTKLHPATDPVP